MKRYVAGLMLSKDDQLVALVRKSHPEWQAGRLNGVGGKIEPGEKPIDAMVREFREEAGLTTDASEWRLFCSVRGMAVYDPAQDGEGWEVYWFVARRGRMDLYALKGSPDEPILVWPIRALINQQHMVAHLLWLLPMAACRDELHAEVLEASRAQVGAAR